ncbi:MAG: fluoride efflux transporter CrcB [Anaerolineae bacterium]|nr:fluoride efflux transporter CrcB [Thermoflexales bacterium]MDW8395695.1 fluoride efflux transporter CrcB [Anaerolineae bacterium]
MLRILLIGAGGFIGAVLRYWLSGYVQRLARSELFPLGTLGVNVLGCLLIGFLSYLAEARSAFTPELRALVFTGILGGFTTFSTFSNETFNLLRGGEGLSALLNLVAHVVLGIGSVWLGRTLAYAIWR